MSRALTYAVTTLALATGLLSSCCTEEVSAVRPYLGALQEGRRFTFTVPETPQRFEMTVDEHTSDAIMLRWTPPGTGELFRLPTRIRTGGMVLAVDEVAFDVTAPNPLASMFCVEGEEFPEVGTTQCRGSCFRSLCFHRTLGLVEVHGYPWIYPGIVATPCQLDARNQLSCPGEGP